MKKNIVLLLLLGITNLLFADPPKPPLGKRWVMNHDFSDEFNGTELDTTKWLDYHPSWKGRLPGLFMPSQVSVGDGYLQIRGEKMDKDTVIHAYNKDLTFSIKGGAVVSKKSVFLGFYECRVKAAATTMSTTFWFSSGKGFEGPNGCDKYGLEWDIQECIGRNGNFDGSYFANGMHSNSHYWYTDCEGKRHDHRASQVKFDDPEVASKDFHVYGGWWRNENSASYYYDNGEPKHQKFYDVVTKMPFDQPMYMRLVCETYPFPWIELPNDKELADPNKNVVYYDWVRGYKLVDVDVDDPNTEDLKPENIPEIFNENITFPEATIELHRSKTLKIPFTYKANKDREIHLKLLDPEGNKIAETSFVAYAGYANMIYNFKVGKKLKRESGYTVVGDIRPVDGGKKDLIYTNTMIVNL